MARDILDRLYPYMPVWLQNAGISLYGLAWRNERMGGQFASYVDGFRSRDRVTPETMDAYVTARLRDVAKACLDGSPYYRRKWTSAGVKLEDIEALGADTLRLLPLTPKQDVRDDPEAFVLSGTPSRGLHRFCTSGSTGTPITAICSSDDHRRFIAAREARSFAWAGVSIHQPRAMIGGRMVVSPNRQRPPFYRYNASEHQVYMSAYHISPASVANYVDGLNRYRPMVMTGYAHSYFTLARLILRSGPRLTYHPQALILGSEALTDGMKETIEDAFGARAYAEYGCVENCFLATECEHGRLHVNPDFGVVEVVDDRGQPVAAGTPGHVVCTGLQNMVQPLFRYDVGDIAVMDSHPCPCGRTHMPVLREVVGRIEDVVVGPDGRELVRFHSLFTGLKSVDEGQVEQITPDRFAVRVVCARGLEAADATAIAQRLRSIVGDVAVAVERVDTIPRSARGKFRAVISRVGNTHAR